MEDSILKSIKYFSFFNYPPTKEETYYFLKKRASFARFSSILEKIPKKNLVNRKLKTENCTRYTLPEYSKNLKLYENKRAISQSKLNNWRFKLYIKILNLFHQIKLVGLSGSISMLNAVEDDDIDLFIITAKNRLFTGRFITVLAAFLLDLKRKRESNGKAQDKVCLNLFFDEADLAMPKFKQSEYVAHEVLQMKPIINKFQANERLLQANLWVQKIFPNSKQVFNLHPPAGGQISNLGNWVEKLLKDFQLASINRHKTSEIVTDTQLWFHPEDFNQKLNNLL